MSVLGIFGLWFLMQYYVVCVCVCVCVCVYFVCFHAYLLWYCSVGRYPSKIKKIPGTEHVLLSVHDPCLEVQQYLGV